MALHSAFKQFGGQNNSQNQSKSERQKEGNAKLCDGAHGSVVKPHQQEHIRDADSRQHKSDCSKGARQ